MIRIVGATNFYRDEFARLHRSRAEGPLPSVTETVARYWRDPWSFLPECRVSVSNKAHYGRRYESESCEATADLRKLARELAHGAISDDDNEEL